jgi:hypothetical protein
MSDLPPPPPPGGGAGSPPSGPPPPPVPGGPPVPAGQPSPVDPHGLGAAAARLGSASRKQGRVALGIASVSLESGEQVELVTQGDIDGFPGVAVLTDRRLLLVNEAAWQPLVETVALVPSLTVAGEADGRAATVTITSPGAVRQIVGGRDVDLAKGFAARLRARSAGV